MADRPPETILPPPPEDAVQALEEALNVSEEHRRARLSAVAAGWPEYLDAWAWLSEHARDDVEGYAYARVGYHRGLDQLRAAGWRGSGRVAWEHPSNRGFLRALDSLGRRAEAIGEDEEAQRCASFVSECDPELAPGDLPDDVA